MELYDYIWKRKSTRKYDMEPLDEGQLSGIRQFAQNMQPLYPDITIEYEITSGVKSILPMKAPYFFIISSEDKEGYLENAGFMFQQMDLYLSSQGLGSCWYGGAKPPANIETKLPFVIIMAFGKAAEEPYREFSGFKRKPLSEVSEGSDGRIEAARLAPSAVNFQNWFFEAKDGKIHVYQKKTLLGSNRLGKIDIGIALCHLYVATRHEEKEFVFTKEKGKEETGFGKNKYLYVGTVD